MGGRASKAPNVHCFNGLFDRAFSSWCPSHFQPTCGGCALISQLVPVQETSLLFSSSQKPSRITHLILKAGASQSISYCQSILTMDPLSTASSIVAVIQISGTVLSVCYRYAALLENAPQDGCLSHASQCHGSQRPCLVVFRRQLDKALPTC